jgi:predicted DNA-binding WGR domain protein
MEMVRLERVDRSRDLSRFYELSIDRDLFGTWMLERCWGWIGAEGERPMAMSFVGRGAAMAKLRRLVAVKLTNGYQVVHDPDGLVPPSLALRSIGATMPEAAAVELERLIRDLPGGTESRMGQIAAAIASLYRYKASSRSEAPSSGQQDLALIGRDDVDYRIKARVLQLLGCLVDAALSGSEVTAVRRFIGDGSNAAIRGSVIRVVPKSRAAYLNFGTVSYFARDRALTRMAIAMQADGVCYLGQVVGLSFDDLLRYAGGRRALVGRLEGALSRLGLFIQAKAPWWVPPDGAVRSPSAERQAWRYEAGWVGTDAPSTVSSSEVLRYLRSVPTTTVPTRN